MSDSKIKNVETSSVKIPKLGMGTWKLEGEMCSQRVKDAIDMGYNLIDTAQIYGNESEVGDGISAASKKRRELFLVSKVWRDNLSRKEVVSSTKESLKKLNTDYIDLMLVHWPNEEFSLEETFQGFLDLKKDGLIKDFGVSNFPLGLLKKCKEISNDFVCNQIEFHPFLDQTEILDWMCENNKFVMAYSPLARGKVFDDSTISKIADKYNAEPAQIVLSWLLSKPGVVTIPKASSKEHLKSNLDSAKITLAGEDLSELDQLSQKNQRIIDPDFAPNWNMRA